jgi:hypothetical protein
MIVRSRASSVAGTTIVGTVAGPSADAVVGWAVCARARIGPAAAATASNRGIKHRRSFTVRPYHPDNGLCVQIESPPGLEAEPEHVPPGIAPGRSLVYRREANVTAFFVFGKAHNVGSIRNICLPEGLWLV